MPITLVSDKLRQPRFNLEPHFCMSLAVERMVLVPILLPP